MKHAMLAFRETSDKSFFPDLCNLPNLLSGNREVQISEFVAPATTQWRPRIHGAEVCDA
jgi:hypothetical protein